MFTKGEKREKYSIFIFSQNQDFPGKLLWCHKSIDAKLRAYLQHEIWIRRCKGISGC